MSLSDLADSLILGVKLDDSPVALPPIRFFWQTYCCSLLSELSPSVSTSVPGYGFRPVSSSSAMARCHPRSAS